MVIDADKSSATGKLLKVYDKAGSKFGILEITMEVVVTCSQGGAGDPDEGWQQIDDHHECRCVH